MKRPGACIFKKRRVLIVNNNNYIACPNRTYPCIMPKIRGAVSRYLCAYAQVASYFWNERCVARKSETSHTGALWRQCFHPLIQRSRRGNYQLVPPVIEQMYQVQEYIWLYKYSVFYLNFFRTLNIFHLYFQ